MKKSIPKLLKFKSLWVHFQTFFFLFMTGAIMATLAFAIDFLTTKLHTGRSYVLETFGCDPSYVGFVVWAIFIVLLWMFAAAICVISPVSKGSGIPEIKTFILGFEPDCFLDFFTWTTLLVKIIGLILATGTGLPVGREGPFIHISSICIIKLAQYLYKRDLEQDLISRKDLFVIGCAIGVAICFSAPIGGVLFSIEATSKYYALKNYGKSFLGGTSGAIIYKLFDLAFYQKNLSETHLATRMLDNFSISPKELFLYVAIGIICGIFGSTFNLCLKYIIKLMNTNYLKIIYNRWWLYTFIVALYFASATYPPGLGKYFWAQLTQPLILKHLFYNNTIGEGPFYYSYLQEPNCYDVYTNNTLAIAGRLITFTIYQFSATLLILTLPMPTGLFVPVFITGAALGNMFGFLSFRFMRSLFASNENFIRGTFAMIGAASFTGSVTQTISTAVIVFEMTGQTTILFPAMISVLSANAVSHFFGPSAYDVLIVSKNLPYIPDETKITYTARDFMMDVRNFKCIEMKNYKTLQNLVSLIDNQVFDQTEYPIIEDYKSSRFIGTVNNDIIKSYLTEKIGTMPDENMYTKKKKSYKMNLIYGSFYNGLSVEKLNETIVWEDLLKFNRGACLQVGMQTPLEKIFELNAVLNAKIIYITSMGRLIGIINTKKLPLLGN